MSEVTVMDDVRSDDFVDDDSWAQPREQAGRGWRVLAGVLGVAILGLGFFTVGVRYQKGRPASGTGGFGAAGFGRNFPGGTFPGAGTGTGSGSGASSQQLSQLFDQLSGGAGSGSAGSGGAGSGSGASGSAGSQEVRGTITKVDGSTVTITKADGSTVTVTLSDATQIGRRAVASTGDLAAGAEVVVSGASGADGAVAADQITLGDLPAETTTTVAGATATTAPGLGGLLPTG